MLHIIGSQGFAAPLVPRLGSQKQDLPSEEEACFMIDLHLAIRGKDVWGRILLSESFKKEWKAFFAHLPPPNLSEEMKSKITTQVSLEIGYCRLNLEEWGKVKEGDFILLDRCSYDPEMQKGNVILALQGKPLFRGRFKENEIKITGYPVYEEVSDAMEEGSFRNRFESDEDEDEDLYEDFDDEDDSEFEEDEEDIFAGLEPRQEAPQKEKVVERKPAQLAPEEETTSLSPTDLPLHLTIEVGRILMTAGALMSLAPGNLLELNVSPEQGVDLVINGKKVGRGELIRMGDVLGVRILSL
jgi:flagellar motor switch protein FliN/FliY